MAERPDRYPWLDLLEVDGPFLSRPALDDVYDEAWPPRLSNEHREILDPPAAFPAEWDDAAMGQVDRLLTDVLGYRDGRTLKFNPGTVIHPVYDNAAVSPYAMGFSRRDSDTPRLVVLAGLAAAETPDSLDPEAITTHYGWPSTAVQRAALAARGLGADLALVTNGYQHLIVWVGSGITGYAWVDPSLYRLDRRLADAFVALLSAASVTTEADTSTADLLRLSQEKQVDVTEKLGIQVRRAAEALVNAVSRANRNTEGKLLAGVAPNEVYTGVVTVLMRTVFLLNAEERDLISRGDLWDRAYSVSGLLAQLDDDHYRHQGVMRRRHGAWLRLLAAARAVHAGVSHSQVNVPAYGGNLFDPGRHPFLEGVGSDGEVFDVGVVDDATTRHVLDLLQRLNGQRLSYRAFSVEQIGQVYESLLGHSAVSVRENSVVLGLVGAKGAEPEVELADLEESHDTGKLADWLAKNHDPASSRGKVEKWQGRLDRTPDERVSATLSQACHGNADVLARVETFAGLLRTDARDVALVFLPGDVYVTETANLRDTGTAYTSPELAAEIAHYALEHLIYEPGPHNEEDESEWQIKPPEEILELRVCDPAVGSGAILVAAVRYLADKLVESRIEHGELTGRDLETAAADPTATDPHVKARRDVVSRCIYAVDRDPMAVEMAKLSLWLITMAQGRPFTFLDHAIKCGDSLLGITSLDQLRRVTLATSPSVDWVADPRAASFDGGQQGRTGTTGSRAAGIQYAMFASDERGTYSAGYDDYLATVQTLVAESQALRRQIRSAAPKDVSEAEQHARMHVAAQAAVDKIRLAADAITAACLSTAHQSEKKRDDRLAELPAILGDLHDPGHITALRKRVERWTEEHDPNPQLQRRFFHWPIEFPEVLEQGGFDAVVGNPPFLGGPKIRAAYGEDYRDYLVAYVADGDAGVRGQSDLVAYFFRRAEKLTTSFGLLATNSICQGTAREVALDPLCPVGSRRIHRAVSSRRWPGVAGVTVAMVWWQRRHEWRTPAVLDGVVVREIETDLYPSGSARGLPQRLPDHGEMAGLGQNVLGSGFLLSDAEARSHLAASPENRDVLFQYRNGEWISASPGKRQRVEQWVINFHQWPIERAQQYEELFRIVEATTKGPRQKSANVQFRNVWWQFANYRKALLTRMAGLTHVIASTRVSNKVIPLRVPVGPVYTEQVVIFPWDDWDLYGLLSSSVHRIWADRYSSTLGTGLRYLPRTTFDTLPYPADWGNLATEMLALDQWRGEIMTSADLGVTDLYAHLHNPDSQDVITCELRERHQALDDAVCAAYRWDDVSLQHGFHDTRYGRFFIISSAARYELLDRLLHLNFEQYSEQTGTSMEQVLKMARGEV